MVLSQQILETTVAQNLYRPGQYISFVVWFLIHRGSIMKPQGSQHLTSSPQAFYVPGQLTVTAE